MFAIRQQLEVNIALQFYGGAMREYGTAGIFRAIV
jgi:hypothetical protein